MKRSLPDAFDKATRKCRPSQVPHRVEPVRKSRRLQGKQPETSAPQKLAPLPIPSTRSRKRKRAQNDQSSQRKKGTPEGSKILGGSTPTDAVPVHPIDYWTQYYSWPPRYAEPDFDMSQPLTRKRSASKLSGDEASTSSQEMAATALAEDLSRTSKSAPYRDARCEIILAKEGAFMVKAPQKINDTSRQMCQKLLEDQQLIPNNTLFDDDIFEKTCESIQSENEARVVLDIMRLIVPSAENLASRATKLEILKEKVNSSWLKCLPLISKRPQPDYSVGFQESAFTDDHIHRLGPFIGKDSDQSSVMARFDMYFPFLTCEAKCGAEGLNIADRQNMHSASVSIKGIVELFKRVGMHQNLHQEILAFSVSHDNRTVRIYGHYPLIAGDKASFYRHEIKAFDITSEEGKEKWAAYKFTRNVYDIFVPIHLKRLCDAIDRLPMQYDFGVNTSLSFTSQPQRDDNNDKSGPPSSQGTDSIARTNPSSQTSMPIFKKPAVPRDREH